MNRLICLLLVVLWPLCANAEPVALRTGEHRDFTRIVAFVPENVDWRIGRNSDGYVLRLPVSDGYDLDGFFDLIPRSRIKGVSQRSDRGDLLLEVDCVCNIRASLLRPTVLVIDVRDGPPLRRSSFELALPGPSVTANSEAVPPQPYRVARNQLLPLFPVAETPSLPDLVAPDMPPDPFEVQEPADPDTPQMDIAALEQSITQSLARGLTSGVLEGAPTLDQENSDGAPTDGLAALAEQVSLPGVASRASTDPLADTTAMPADVTQDGRLCLPDHYFAFATWGDGRSFFDQIAEARATLVNEAGAVEETAVVALAKLYLHFGFGREAIQTLRLDGAQSQKRQVLHTLAAILDGDRIAGVPLNGQVSCPSDVALWAMLANEDPPFDAQVDRVAALRAFKGLPGPVQDAVGARLSERFLQIGDLDAASQVLAAKSSTASKQVEASLAAASLSAALGETVQARQSIVDVVQSDPRATPAAMIRFFEQGIADGSAFVADDFLLADTLRFEQAGTQAAADLATAQVKAYTAAARYEAAHTLLQSAEQEIGPEVHARLSAANWTQAAAQMPDAPFLALIWSEAANVRDPMAQNAVASRLVDIGFPDRALAVLTGPADSTVAEERKIIRARAEIALGRPDLAEEVLRDVDIEPAQALRDAAASLRRSLDFQAETVAEQDPVLAAPDVFSQPDDGALEVVTEIVTQREPTELDTDVPLTEGRALLERSARSRETLEALLERFAVPADF